MIFLFFVSMFRPNMIPLVAWNYWHTFRTLWLPHQKTPSSTRMNANAVILLKARLCYSASIHLWYRALFTIYRCDWHMNVICWDVQIPRQIGTVCGRGSKDYQLSYRSSTWKTQPWWGTKNQDGITTLLRGENRDFKWIQTSQKRSWWVVVPGLPT